MSHSYEFIIILARFIVGLVFLIACASKLLQPVATVNAVRAYALLPERIAFIAAAILPWLEGSIGLLLIVGQLVFIATLLAIALLCLFTIAQIIVLSRGQQVMCGCFGSFDHSKVGSHTIIRNAVLVVLALVVMASYRPLVLSGSAISFAEQTVLFLIALAVIGIYALSHQMFRILSLKE